MGDEGDAGELETGEQPGGSSGPEEIPGVKVGNDNQVVFEELKDAGFGEEVGALFPGGETVEFPKEDMEQMLALAFLTVSNSIFERVKWNNVSLAEADRWAKCTRIVYWKYLQTFNASILLWGFMTAGIIATKKPMGGEQIAASK